MSCLAASVQCVCVRVCVRERERERGRETDRQTDRQRQRDREREKQNKKTRTQKLHFTRIVVEVQSKLNNQSCGAADE